MPNATRKQPRELLNEAAARLKRQWPGMSARAVAAKLKITPSYWSKVLRGKKPITQALLPRLIKVLGLDAQQVAQLQRAVLDSIESEQLTPATGIRTRGVEKESPAEEYRNLGRQDFWMLK
ncbi:MAG: helix-turn-helix domain-containing protein, partial [Bdellovibrionota bacterium]